MESSIERGLIAASIIVAALLVSCVPRYEVMVPSGGRGGFLTYDRWTGDLKACGTKGPSQEYCEPVSNVKAGPRRM